MKNTIKVIGGLLLFLIPILLIAMLWCEDYIYIFKLLLTDVILMGTIFLLDKATDE